MKLILVDGECNMCNGVVRFVHKYDKKSEIRFGSLQSEYAHKILEERGHTSTLLSTFVYIVNGSTYTKSTAFVHLLSDLGYPWRILSIVRFIPLSVRDFVYACISKNRYKLFGKRDICIIPDKELRNKFISEI